MLFVLSNCSNVISCGCSGNNAEIKPKKYFALDLPYKIITHTHTKKNNNNNKKKTKKKKLTYEPF